MRLLYWYTRFLDERGGPREYRGLTEFELNLSTDTSYHFDWETRRLFEKKLDTPLPYDFWGHGIYNLNVLTGDNGAGKSSIMQVIMETLNMLYRGEYVGADETVIIFELSEKRCLLHLSARDESREFSIESEALCYCRYGDPLYEEVMSALERTKLIYLTNTLSETDDKRVQAYAHEDHIRYHFIYDCSTSGLIRYDEKDDCRADKLRDPLWLYFTNEVYKQVKFVCKKLGLLKRLRKRGYPAPLPERLIFTIREVRLVSQPEIPLSQQIINRLCRACLDTFYENMSDDWNAKFRLYDILEEVLPNNSSGSAIQWEEVFKKIFDILGLKSNRVGTLPSHCLSFVKFLCEDPDILSRFTDIDIPSLYSVSPARLSLSLAKGDNLSWLSKFISLYIRTCAPYYYIDFSWGLSSGETNILRLFSSLYYVFGYKYKASFPSHNAIYNVRFKGIRPVLCDTILLLMDEADLTYHPEWQRQFVSLLTAFLPEIFNENCGIRDIQILLTTHSPLLIGDIPKSCVTYLGKSADSGQIETFGQNIHLILKDSFFLSKGTVGAFAEKKINDTAVKLIRIAKRYEKKEPSDLNKPCICARDRDVLDACRNLIELVAPGVLKNKLVDLYREADCALSAADGSGANIRKVKQMRRETLEELAKRYLAEHREENI